MDVITSSTIGPPNISWLNPAKCSFKIDHPVDVWKIGINANLQFLEEFISILKPDELDRAGRYRQLKDKNRFIVSRGALRIILGKYFTSEPSLLQFALGANKKPFITNAGKPSVHYNLSHSGDQILLAVSNSEIGADVEFIDPSFKYRDILEDNFSAGEIAYINQDNSLERFFLSWTRKEALLKAAGTGLDCDLKVIPALDGVHEMLHDSFPLPGSWFVSSFNINDAYAASIASRNEAKPIAFWDYNLIS